MSATKRALPAARSARISTRTTTESSLESTRITRLTSRVSELNPRVTLFEPTSTISDVGQGVVKLEESAEEAEEDEQPSPRRKRVKLDIADLEDLAYSPSGSRARARNSTPRKKQAKGKNAVKKDDDDADDEDLPTASPSSAKKSISPKKTKVITQSLSTPHPAPPNWRETYDTIKGMRSRFVAPVDTMGCDQAQTKEVDPKNRRYATLVSLMLSSQTKDEVTDAAVSKLRTALGGSISVDAMVDAEESVISDAIAKVGFWRRKTGYLKQTAMKLRSDFSSDIPKTVDELCSLPGVGPKMAFLALQIAWGLNHGIGVDVHVHRITNLLGWHKPPTKNPEQTRLNLQSWLPKDLHGDINHMLVGFGQVVCLPVSPRCDMCELATKGLCPSARKVVKSVKGRKEVVFSKVEALEEPMVKIEIEIEKEALEEKVMVFPPSA